MINFLFFLASGPFGYGHTFEGPRIFFPILIIVSLISIMFEAIFFYFDSLWDDLFEVFEVNKEALDEDENELDDDEFDDFSDDPLSDFTSLDETVFELFEDTKIKFDDVAGNEEAKVELKEVVRFLKDPASFSKLGASVPKGVLLGGPPGTGKTLLAKAIAGESGTRFIKISGSQFVELLAGVGAARVRELFETARELQPSIIFIDEIDSIARARSGNNTMGGGSDEREQTLNQILTEMDGFESNTGIVVIGATNRIDILDPAIKRPGRFDRQITINNPTLKERFAILQVHARGKKLDPQLSLYPVALRTIGFSGADLANVLNEAAILATRYSKPFISMREINISIDRLIIGLEGKQSVRVKARQLTAFHEMGHAFIGTLINQKMSIEKLTIIPRGSTQGSTWISPSTSQYMSREDFVNQIFVSLGGRAAEELLNGISECTVGAQQDIAQLTRTMRVMILRYSMGRLQILKQEAQQKNLLYIGSDVKTELNNIIDDFTTNFIRLVYSEVLTSLSLLRPIGERVVDSLLVYEEISGKELRYMAREYISISAGTEPLFTGREAYIFKRLTDKYRKTTRQLEKEAEIILNTLKEKQT